ncbi:patatin-like phospholipase family protein [Pseudomonas sp. REP124]|uniref:patatin-like phospholipase family protein n=1 Tax=Pseudomonas sp. REP124 TaxID=2875731 RepID=UPI001CCC9F30|nr:patatin-like phospholipase family protein [Pseudomonas sp. REP124]MBZ9780207.1 patatin-like phospholipase family protein [Pseudomonas sp. REP124]
MKPFPLRPGASTLDMFLQACLPRRDAVPPALTERAIIPGIPNARFRLDRDVTPFIQDAVRANKREADVLAEAGMPIDVLPLANMLAVSGGGDAGAFAAGLIAGWTTHGTRPMFKVVTGISAGALVAPFAFLGPQYDGVIRYVTNAIGPKDIFHSRSLLTRLASDGIADSKPLSRLIAKYVTEEILAQIAAEYAKGRILLIGTTDLDSGRPVTWNMGAIAESQAPGALELFRNIMIASMSIPGAVSPVMIDVEVDGKQFHEMHVDGGVITQVFLYPPGTLVGLNADPGAPVRLERNFYVIRNGTLEPQWSGTKRRTLSIGGRAISALIQTQGISDLERIYRMAQQDGADFNLAYIGADFDVTHLQKFDGEYMKRLFDYAFELSAKGYPWHKTPDSEKARLRVTR